MARFDSIFSTEEELLSKLIRYQAEAVALVELESEHEPDWGYRNFERALRTVTEEEPTYGLILIEIRTVRDEEGEGNLSDEWIATYPITSAELVSYFSPNYWRGLRLTAVFNELTELERRKLLLVGEKITMRSWIKTKNAPNVNFISVFESSTGGWKSGEALDSEFRALTALLSSSVRSDIPYHIGGNQTLAESVVRHRVFKDAALGAVLYAGAAFYDDDSAALVELLIQPWELVMGAEWTRSESK